MRNALAQVPRGQHSVVATAIRQAISQPASGRAGTTWRHTADQIHARWTKLAAIMDESKHGVLSWMAFPAQHRTKLHSTTPIERLDKEVERRADVVGILPDEASITRLIGALLFEQNDEWATRRRYMQVEAFSKVDAAEPDLFLGTTMEAA